MRARHDPRAAVDVEAGVRSISDAGLASVQAHPNSDRMLVPHMLSERDLSISRSRNRIPSVGKRHEEAVTLGIDLGTAVKREGSSKYSPMCLEGNDVPLAPERM
jgi:hypothetical protein